MIYGFSGSRHGITPQQYEWLNKTLRSIGMTEFHHGACIGADLEAHRIALDYFKDAEGWGQPIIVHPAADVDPRNLAQECLVEHPLVKVLPAKNALLRNRDIVKPSGLLLVTPDGPERLRSGTWSTVRYAAKLHVPVLACYPDGTPEEL